MKIPSHTQVPNYIIDEFMTKLSHAEFKIAIAICRKTVGWHKQSDFISLSQIRKMTGATDKTILKSIERMETLGLITTHKRGRSTTRITINIPSGTGTNTVGTGTSIVETTGVSIDTKETIKETNTKYFDPEFLGGII
jgi:phage replication O-like protein O